MKLFKKLRALFLKNSLDREMSEEMRHHLELEAQENLALGLSHDEARFAAQRHFGHVEGIKEQVREQRGLPWLEHILQDFGYGFRLLRKSPGFTAITVVTLALGIGATAAIFTVVNSVILEPLPYRDSGRLASLRESFKGQPSIQFVSRVTFREWKDQATSFESMATTRGWSRTMIGFGPPQRMYAWRVSVNYFSTLGIQPVLGRTFQPEEGIAGKDDVLIISHRLWLGRFNARPDIIGQQVTIDEHSFTIIGVLPANFLPETVTDPAFFAPDPETRSDQGLQPRYIEVIGRLKPGVTLEQAGRELAVISARSALKFPETNQDWTADIAPVLEAKIGKVKPFLLLLLGAVAFLLLIACVNVANLLLARASTRAKEIAVRIALGASRGRIVSQLLCESLLISTAGSALGILLAYGGLQLLLDNTPLALPRAQEIAINGTVLGFSCLLALVTGVGFGLAPALQASRTNPQQAIRDHGRGNSAAGGALKLRSALVACEVALALVLLMVAGLLIHSFARMQQVPLGFKTNTAYLARNILPAYRYPTPQSQIAFVNAAIEHLAAVPGVHSAVFANDFPAFGLNDLPYRIDSRPDLEPHSLPPANFFIITQDFFRALNMQLVAGRLFDARDNAGAPPVTIISQGFAKKYFPQVNPLGQRVTVLDKSATPVSREIVGVVNDVRDNGPLIERPFQIYAPFEQAPFAGPDLLIRVDGPLAGIEPSLRHALDLVDPEMPLSLVTRLDYTGFLNETIAPQRFALFVFTLFASVALLLSALGIYGVVSYSVTQRTQEIGIRMALGALPRDILRLIFSQTGQMVGAGVAVGLVASFIATRYLGSLLFEISTHDPVAYLAVPLFLALIALLACWLPARRATKVNPIIALRAE
jgi:putative ABC transport system permease protein